LNLELGLRAKETDVEFEQEVRLAEDDREVVRLRPGEREPNRVEGSDGRIQIDQLGRRRPKASTKCD